MLMMFLLKMVFVVRVEESSLGAFTRRYTVM